MSNEQVAPQEEEKKEQAQGNGQSGN